MRSFASLLTALLCLLFHVGCCPSAWAAEKSDLVFTPGELWNDADGVPINAHGGGFLYDHGTYYWFGEFKVAGTAGNKAHVGISCYSSKDLYRWKNRGIVMPVSTDSSSDIADGSIIERPKVLYNRKTHAYVMWFHLELKGQGYRAARAGVAISKKPTGPYRYLRSFRPDGEMSRDMTLFEDDDGSAYLVTASEDNKTMHVSQLDETYLNTTGKFQQIFIGQTLEAPAIFKRNGKYYFVGSHCTGWAPNPAVSAVADSILGPWTMLGNPARGPDADLTFHGQSTYVLKVMGLPDAFIFIADRWNPQNAIDGRYIWLPVQFQNSGFFIPWMPSWDLSIFAKSTPMNLR
jgi:sucrose-6-phosphate hydrolase SacC (GH32 family)